MELREGNSKVFLIDVCPRLVREVNLMVDD